MAARVIVVAGPSGSGKSVLCGRLAASLGLPVVHLDDFYKDGDDPSLPRIHLPAGAPIVDWDHPESWDREHAVAALHELCTTGSAEVPVYDIASDGRIGHRQVTVGGSAYVLAEGVFADQVVERCREAGVLAAAICVHNHRVVTFWRRLTRDLREGRKSPWVLVRRGVALLRAEPEIVDRAVRAGCTVMTSRDAAAYLRRVATG